LWAVVLVALALRLMTAMAPLTINTNAVNYVQHALAIAAGGTWFHPVYSPGYSILVGGGAGCPDR